MARPTATLERKSGTRQQQRTRRRFLRRQWARRWLTWRYVVSAVVLLAVVGGGVYLVWFSPVLAVQSVAVSGTTTLTPEQITAAAEVPEGGPLATADLDAVQHRVAALATVASVDVTRQWPHTVHITVVERTPVAAVSVGGQFRALDASGVEFGTYRQRPAGLPLVQASATADADALQQAALVVAALPDRLRGLTDHVELRSADDIRLVLQGDRTVQWGSAADSADKAAVLATLLQRQAPYYDVSVPGAPVTARRVPS